MKTKIPWASILLESFLVVLGVVLALAANSWRQARAQDQQAAAALAAIVEELGTNREAVADAMAYHAEMIGGLRAFAASGPSDEQTPSGALFEKGFVAPASILDHAFQTATSTGAVEHIPYDSVLAAARLYQEQERYESGAALVAEQVYRSLFESGRQGVVRNWRNHTQIVVTLMYRECQLLQSYGEILPGLPGGEALEIAETPQECRYAVDR